MELLPLRLGPVLAILLELVFLSHLAGYYKGTFNGQGPLLHAYVSKVSSRIGTDVEAVATSRQSHRFLCAKPSARLSTLRPQQEAVSCFADRASFSVGTWIKIEF